MRDLISLVNVKSDRVIHPLGILYVGSALKKAGFDVKLYNIEPDEIDKKIHEIIDQKPLFTGFSVITGNHTALSAEMSHKLKKLDSSIPIVWGGVHPSLVPKQCLQDSFVDIAVIGEGEETSVELASILKNKLDLKGVKGIGFKLNGQILLNEPRPLITNLNKYHLDWSLIDTKECIDVSPDGTKSMLFITSRGCPFNCGFCYNLEFNKRKWRPYSFDYVVKEITILKELTGINGIIFRDDHFMVKIPRALKILKFLKDNGISCMELEMRLDLLNEDILNTLTEYGVKSLFLGWESGSNRILKLINKRFTRNKIIEKFKLISRYPSIGISAAGIIGFPTETLDETRQTIDLGVKLAEMVPKINVTFQTYLPFPGTDLYQLAVRQGHTPPKKSTDWKDYNTFYGNMKMEWLPWADSTTPRIFYRIDKYGKLLNHGASTSFLRTLGKKICFLLARARLKKYFFYFPFEIFILFNFNRYYRDNKNKLIKR